MKKLMSCLFAMSLMTAGLFAQSIMTANDFFKKVSEKYGSINNYEANVNIKIGKSDMEGRVSFMRPEMLRIDFTDPAEQTIVFNGDKLVVYLPGNSAILEQEVSSSAKKVATADGLALLRRYYTVSYVSGQAEVPLDENSNEMVIKLKLQRRSSTEAFREIIISIDPATNLIRRVVASSSSSTENYEIDFLDYKLNTAMSEQRFLYDPPSSANNYSNFLLSE